MYYFLSVVDSCPGAESVLKGEGVELVLLHEAQEEGVTSLLHELDLFFSPVVEVNRLDLADALLKILALCGTAETEQHPVVDRGPLPGHAAAHHALPVLGIFKDLGEEGFALLLVDCLHCVHSYYRLCTDCAGNNQRMSSPHRLIHDMVDSEIRHRSRFSADNNVDFYQLKLLRLEKDFMAVQDELNAARIRLRTAEDYQIKYDLLTKQNATFLTENAALAKELSLRKIQVERVLEKLEIQSLDVERVVVERLEIEKLVVARDLEIRDLLNRLKGFQIDAENEAIRASRMHNGEVFTLRKANKDLEQIIKGYENTSSGTVAQLSEHNSKLKEQVKNLEQELSRCIKRQQEELSKVHKNREIIERDFEQKIHTQRERFESYEKTIQDRDEKDRREREQTGTDSNAGYLRKEIDNLTELLNDKTAQLEGVFEQKDINLQNWATERDQLRRHIELLEEKLYEKERENEIQLFNMKERLAKLHAEEIGAFKLNEKELIEALNALKPDDLLKNKDQEILLLKDRIQNNTNLHEKDKEVILKGIDTLKDRIREHNESADSQHKILTSLNLNIEEERTSAQTDFQNNLTFLDQQLKRANLTIEQKNLEIKKLLNELSDLKNDTEKERKELVIRAESQRRKLNEEIDRLLTERQQAEDELKKKQKEVKVKDRQLEEVIAKSVAERKAFERLQEELHNDCKRMGEELKLTEKVVRDERQKNVSSVTELNSVRREKVGDLDRQKEEFELLYRGRMDQLKDSLQLQIDRLRVERDRLSIELTSCRLQLTETQQNLKKVSSLVVQESKMNKQKLSEYQKKMATLNMEINLTQNLYNSFMDAKSRLKQSRSQKEN